MDVAHVLESVANSDGLPAKTGTDSVAVVDYGNDQVMVSWHDLTVRHSFTPDINWFAGALAHSARL